MPNEGLRLELPPTEHAQLQKWASALGTPQQVALRCRIVLAALAGEDNVSIAHEQGVRRRPGELASAGARGPVPEWPQQALRR
jgi:hypothetical protein